MERPARTRDRAGAALEALVARPEVDASRAAVEAEMRDVGVDRQMHLSGKTVHGFINRGADRRGMPDAIRYNPEADARSWASMTELFGEAPR